MWSEFDLWARGGVWIGRWAVAASLVLGACPDAPPPPRPDPLDVWIGQMLVVGFRGTELAPDDPFLAQIRDLHLGGVILFDYDVPSKNPVRNIVSAEQVRRLTAQLQSAAEIPLFVAVDQEGGRIARLKASRGFPATLSQAELGRLDDEQATRRNARAIAETLRDLGFNLNFAPVLDLALNPESPIIAKLERSYGVDPAKVARHARWTIEEFHNAGVLSCVKHFPGHGSSRGDSHLGLPDVTADWTPLELEPFQTLIREGLPDMVMTAHLFNADWDAERPATLSPAVIRGALRTRLGFRGVVVSDDMQMGAIVQNYSFEKGIEMALKAGVDILAIGNNQRYDPDAAPKAVAVVRDLVRRGVVPRGRILRSYLRISRLKKDLPQPPPASPEAR